MKNEMVFEKLKSIIVEGPDRLKYLDDETVQVRYQNILLSYPITNTLVDLPALLSTVRRADAKIRESLNYSLKQIEIEIYTDREQWKENHSHVVQDMPSWVSGDSGRIIRIVIQDEKSVTFPELQLMLSHECIHLVVRTMASGRAPAWLDEGLAVFLSQNLPHSYLETLNNAIEHEALLPFDILIRPFTGLGRGLKTLAYSQSCSVVEYLQGKYGWEAIRELLAAAARNDDLETVLRKYSLTMYLLEKEWLQTMRSRGRQ